MQEVILAVFSFAFFKTFLPFIFIGVLAAQFSIILRCYLENKRRKEWERDCEFRRKQERRIQRLWDEAHKPKTIKRRKDHPLTTIFKSEMPKSNYQVKKLGKRPSDLAISKGNF